MGESHWIGYECECLTEYGFEFTFHGKNLFESDKKLNLHTTEFYDKYKNFNAKDIQANVLGFQRKLVFLLEILPGGR